MLSKERAATNYPLPATRYPLYFDHLVAIAELVDFDPHPLGHQQKQVAHMGVRVRRAAAKPVVFTRFVELVAVELKITMKI
jgi:hypothetical protein